MSWLFCVGVLAAVVGWPVQANDAATSDVAASRRAFLNEYCVACHNARLQTAGLSLEQVETGAVGSEAALWEKIVSKLRSGAMPPPGRPRPDVASMTAIVGSLESALDEAANARPIAGRPAVHRLNRVEYANAVRDLLAFEIDGRTLFPADDTDEHGFDNNATVLSVSPALLERYMSAARTISQTAVGLSDHRAASAVYAVSKQLQQTERMSEDLPFGSAGGVAARHYFPADGDYELTVRLQRNLHSLVRGLGSAHELDVRLDGVLVRRFSFGGESRGETPPLSFGGSIDGSPEWEAYARSIDADWSIRIPVKAGLRVIGAAFVAEPWVPDEVAQPLQTGYGRDLNERFDGEPGVESVTITGPIAAAGGGATPSRERIFVCRPRSRADEMPCARTILSTLARRAYRKPATTRDTETLMKFYQAREAESFDERIAFAIEKILSSPAFLFRIEHEEAGSSSARDPYPLTDVDLASRLSFFMWSSIPDDQLLEVSARGQLRAGSVMEQQVRRMLRDRRSSALVENFAAQWLRVRNLRDATPDPDLYPDFDENLREAFRRETELFVADQIQSDRSVLELLGADYTFVNERLARHYGIPHVYGERFRRVTFSPEEARGGLLGQGSILTVTSYPNRTSPVLRGAWLLDNILGTPPPDPPPNVPALSDKGENGAAASVRQRLEAHRRNPVCATCHAQMDPLGFALESFDAIGRWRTEDAGVPVDATGTLPSGATFVGPTGLRAYLLTERRDAFAATVVEKLLTYALGRNVEYYDRPVIRAILRQTAADNYRWSSVILAIARSMPFQMRSRSS